MMDGWMDGGAQNVISKLAAEHLADFNSPTEQKNKTKTKKTNLILLRFRSETFSQHSACG